MSCQDKSSSPSPVDIDLPVSWSLQIRAKAEAKSAEAAHQRREEMRAEASYGGHVARSPMPGSGPDGYLPNYGAQRNGGRELVRDHDGNLADLKHRRSSNGGGHPGGHPQRDGGQNGAPTPHGQVMRRAPPRLEVGHQQSPGAPGDGGWSPNSPGAGSPGQQHRFMAGLNELRAGPSDEQRQRAEYQRRQLQVRMQAWVSLSVSIGVSGCL